MTVVKDWTIEATRLRPYTSKHMIKQNQVKVALDDVIKDCKYPITWFSREWFSERLRKGVSVEGRTYSFKLED